MSKKKIIFPVILMFLLTSCAGGWDEVKQGLTGQKRKSTDEFLVKKKDPLILPPEFESLPTPADSQQVIKEVSSFEKKLTGAASTENASSTTISAEQSILKKIPKTSTTGKTSTTTNSSEESLLRQIQKQ